MPVKTSGFLKFSKKLRDLLPDARSNFAKEMKAEIVDVIVEKITSGLSPVKGQNRYPKYSDGYAKEKGRKAPVDLVESGQMLNSLKAVQKSNGNIELKFMGKEANDKASGHQFGANNLPVRKILPQGRDQFKSDIQKKILKTLEDAVKKAAR